MRSAARPPEPPGWTADGPADALGEGPGTGSGTGPGPERGGLTADLTGELPAARPRAEAPVAVVVDAFDAHAGVVVEALVDRLREHGLRALVHVGPGAGVQDWDVADLGRALGSTLGGLLAPLVGGAGAGGPVAGFVAVAGAGGRLPRAIPSAWGDLPAVLVGTRAPGVPSVAGDDLSAMRALVSHLVDDAGARRPAFLAAPAGRRGAPSLAETFLAAARDRGLMVDPDRVVPGPPGRLAGYRATGALLHRFPEVDCIVTGDDETALGVLDALAESGADVPGRIRVAGCGDDGRASRNRPPLTSVDRRPHDQGRLAADLLVARLRGDPAVREETVEPRLVVRRSTLPPPPHLRPVPDPDRWPPPGGGDLLDRAESAVGPLPDVLDAGWTRRWLDRLGEQMAEGRLHEPWARSWGRPVGSVDEVERATEWLTAASRAVHDAVADGFGPADRSAAADVLVRVVARLTRASGEPARAAERADALAAQRVLETRAALDSAGSTDAALGVLGAELDALGVRRLVAVVPEPPGGGGGRVALAYDEGRVLTAGSPPAPPVGEADPDAAGPVVVRPLVAGGETVGVLAYEPGRGRDGWVASTVPDDLVTALELLLARDRWRAGAARAAAALAETVAAAAELEAALDGERDRRVRAEAELRRATSELSVNLQVDPLTGIHNRAGLDAAMEREWGAHVSNRRPMALLMVDVDHFKAYNDRYGHPQGDATLRAVAHELRRAAHRGNDLAARYGGEEFALVLPDTDVQTAELVAEAVLGAVREAGIEHAAAPAGFLTVSVGVAVCIPAAEWTATDLVRAADGALYRAKAAGRDRSVTTVTVPPVATVATAEAAEAAEATAATERAVAPPTGRRALEGLRPRH
ncbi:MAG: diguanylate cyclase [Kineosporiaceae bacterium]